MNKPTKPLIDDLLEEVVPPEFQAALLDKTLQAARQRKRSRHLRQALCVTAFVGICTFALLELRTPKSVSNQNRRSASPVDLPPPSRVHIVGTEMDSASALTIVETTESARPREINDEQLLAVLSDAPVALARQGAHEAELMLLNAKDENGLPVR